MEIILTKEEREIVEFINQSKVEDWASKKQYWKIYRNVIQAVRQKERKVKRE